MPSGQHGSGSDAYRPTSINFINLPNPIEPSQTQAGSQKHPLNGTPHLEKARLEQSSNRDLLNYILEPSSERPSKRQKPADGSALDLPKLPVRQSNNKRLRIPPTLSGLHQPPPDAGLLPSISVEQPKVPPPRQHEPAPEPPSKPVERKEVPPETHVARHDAAPAAPPQKARQRRKWSDQETEDLLKGVARFGIGSWTKIMNCEDYHFDNRTALDLKDRFRVCCPDAYKKPKASTPSKGQSTAEKKPASDPKPKTSTKGPPREEISSSKLKELGINEPFVNVRKQNRAVFTAEEDDALLRGFKKYGNAWATISRDSTLGLLERRPAELRDRFRTHFAAEYAKSERNKAGSLPNQEKRARVEGDGRLEFDEASDAQHAATSRKEDTAKAKPTEATRPARLPYFSLDDVFLNGDFDDNYDDGEPVVLDRGILDWAGADAGKSATAEASKNTGINPLMTLKPPKPMSNNVLTALPSATSTSQQQNQTSLPSIASMFPDTSYPDDDQVELPSLMTNVASTENPTENDGKTRGGGFPAWEDLLT